MLTDPERRARLRTSMTPSISAELRQDVTGPVAEDRAVPASAHCKTRTLVVSTEKRPPLFTAGGASCLRG